MVRGGIFLLIVVLTAPSLAAAETISFADFAAAIARSCGTDIRANCRGVNFDISRLKECLYRNQDVTSPQCKTDFFQNFDRDPRTDRGAHHGCQRLQPGDR